MQDSADRVALVSDPASASKGRQVGLARGQVAQLVLKAGAAMAISSAGFVLVQDFALSLWFDRPFAATTLGTLLNIVYAHRGRLGAFAVDGIGSGKAELLLWLWNAPLASLFGFVAVATYAIYLLAASHSRTHAQTDVLHKTYADRSVLAAALVNCRKSLVAVGLFSGIASLLVLTSPLYMLEIYDRVIPSRSVPTLIGLSIIAAFMFATIGVYDMIRTRMLGRIGAILHEEVGDKVFRLTAEVPLRLGTEADGLQAVRDIESLRVFFLGTAPSALFDLPFVPVFVLVLFVFHPLFGILTLAGAAILVSLAITSEVLTRRTVAESTRHAGARLAFAQSARQNAEVIAAMGMHGTLVERWREINRRYLAAEQSAGDVSAGLKAMAKSIRLILQSTILGAGAYLVLGQQASAGVIVAASIIAARALAPIDAVIASWKSVLAARQSWSRLENLFARFGYEPERLTLPRPSAHFQVDGVCIVPPGTQRLTVQNVSFALRAGQGLGIIGPSGSGKSCLVRALVGAWRPVRGRISLDGAALEHWAPSTLGRHIGYLPQQVDLFAGTVAENISRFAPRPDPDTVIVAARAAGVHELISELPNGYDTAVGEHGGALSAGQQQLIGLARALYGDPFLVVMDEPNSNLDSDGEAILTQALLGARSRGSIVIVVAHRPNALAAVDMLLVMAKGQTKRIGLKEELMPSLRLTTPPSVPLVTKGSVA